MKILILEKNMTEIIPDIEHFDETFVYKNVYKYWHPVLNRTLTPRDFTKTSNEKAYFLCNECGHSFYDEIYRFGRSGCLFCSRRDWVNCELDNCIFCFNKSFASHPKCKYWNYEKNEINPNEIVKTSSTPCWFTCPDCKHDFKKGLNEITTGKRWCRYCTPKWIFCDNMSCDFCIEKSFISHEKSVYWNYEKNYGKDKKGNVIILSPYSFTKGSEYVAHFICNKCDHNFEVNIDHVTNEKTPQWCPYCSKNTTGWTHCDKPNCSICFGKSFASDSKAKYWHPTKNINVLPLNISVCSGKMCWFLCECGHEYLSSPNILKYKDDIGCVYCRDKFVMHCGNESCTICNKKSFIDHPKSLYFDKQMNGDIDLKMIGYSSNKKFWFKCNECRTRFESSPNKIMYGRWCPTCKHKTEKKLFLWLRENISENVECQKIFEWGVNDETGKVFKYDFFIVDLDTIVEVDGGQHFRQISNWENPCEIQNRDIKKMKLLMDHGLSIVRIYQEDVLFDKNDWKTNLTSFIFSNDKKIKCIRTSSNQINEVYEMYENVTHENMDENTNVKII